MIIVIDGELGEKEKSILETQMERYMLPSNGIIVFAIQEILAKEDPEFANQLVSGEQFLLDVIDRYEEKPPKTKKEKAEFAQVLRYAAQFMTTRLIHPAKFENERPAEGKSKT